MFPIPYCLAGAPLLWKQVPPTREAGWSNHNRQGLLQLAGLRATVETE